MSNWRRPEQPSLLGIDRADHSHRGGVFERELEAVHLRYRIAGTVDVVKNPSGWDFARGQDFYKARANYNAGQDNAARTAAGGYLQRVYSDVDFSGGNGTGAFCFDAKETKGSRLPLSNVKGHQVTRLKQSARCGTTAGLMVKFTEHDRVFFVPIAAFEPKYEAWLRQSTAKAAPGTASLSIPECESLGAEIFRDKMNRLWDWYQVLGRETNEN
jgi:penicillin-binding protein-related factor A (putative recombinase)